MSYLFTLLMITLVLLAVFHFIWSGIIMPAYRQLQRNRLFSLRDKVRNLRISGSLNEHEFELVHGLINYHVSHLNQLQLSSLWAFHREYERNAKFRNRIDAEFETIKNISDPRLSEVVEETADVCRAVCVLNSGGWLIFVIPAIIAFVFTARIRQFALKQVAHGMFTRDQNSSLQFSY